MTSQTQEAGDNSTNIQAGSVTILQGVSITEGRQIALDVFRTNFIELSGSAEDVARQRAEEITEDFLKKLQEQHATGLTQAQEPDFQYALFTVQKEYARCGDKALGDLLVDLLVDRTKHASRTILQIVLNESLTVAPKLTLDQLAALSVIFLFRYSIIRGINNQQTFWESLDRYVRPLAPLLSARVACYQHLEYSGCGTVGMGSVALPEILRRNYGGLFSKGFEDTQLKAKQLSIPNSHPIFTKCLNDGDRLQVNGLTEDVIRSEGARLEIAADDISRLVSLHHETMMNHEEVVELVAKARDYMRSVFDVWKTSSMSHFALTSVGIAIGHANVKKSVGEFTDLSIWIN
jgi:hypothetical protein